jgi:molybdopterin-guanine dinucleotide biosynthesis protein A
MTAIRPFDAIVLSGGAARRLGGADKPGMVVGGGSLLERVLDAASGARRTVVVGPPRPTTRPVRWCREQPPGGGPVAAIEAGLRVSDADVVVLLAADLPWIEPAVPALLAGLAGADAAVLVDPEGRRNFLAAAWRRAALMAALDQAADPAGAAVRALYEGRRIIEILDRHGWGQDCDTWADLDAARRRGEQGSST